MQNPIHVICSRCRAAGSAGEGDFADLGDLLAFEPVPRRPRVDGWTPEVQRAFIAALAVTGSPRRACTAVGKAQFGADQLRAAKDNESFLAAWDAAMAIARDKGTSRLAEGVDAAARADAAWTPPPQPWSHAATRQGRRPAPPPPAPTEQELEQQDKAEIGLLHAIVKNYLIKLEQERKARLDGRIAEADFYVRQVTMLEVSLDMASGDGMKLLKQYRREGHDLLHIAETEFSKLMDMVRRAHWNDMGEPERPEYPPRHLLVAHDGFSTEPLETTWGGAALSHNEQRRVFEEQHAHDAAAQVAWEATARAEAAAWRTRMAAEGTAEERPDP